jgi:drug/metabolite transporter (DMT)-like permease
MTDAIHKKAPEAGPSRLALPALFTGAAAIALAPIFVRIADVGPAAKAFWRLVFALPFLWMGVYISSKKMGVSGLPKSKSDLGLTAAAGLFFAADLSVWHLSLKYTTVANATLLPNFAPVFVALGAWIFLKERIRLSFIGGMAVALAGTVLMVGASFTIDIGRFWGDALGLATAVFYAGYLLSVKSLRSRFSTVAVMAASGTVTCAAVLAVSLAAGEKLIPGSGRGWAVLIAMGIVSHVFGQGLIAYALAHLKAGFSSVGLLLQPVLATALAWALFHETLGPLQAAGGALVLAGIIAARRE